MNYFIVAQDQRLPNAVEPAGIARAIKKEWLTVEGMEELETIDRQFPIVEKRQSDYVDFIERPVALLSDKLKQLIERYEPRCSFKPVILAEIAKGKQTPYWLAIPPKVSCLAPETSFQQDGTLKNLVIDEALAAPYPFFQVEGIHETFLVINIELAESILRRGFRGITLQRVDTIGRWQELFATAKEE